MPCRKNSTSFPIKLKVCLHAQISQISQNPLKVANTNTNEK